MDEFFSTVFYPFIIKMACMKWKREWLLKLWHTNLHWSAVRIIAEDELIGFILFWHANQRQTPKKEILK